MREHVYFLQNVVADSVRLDDRRLGDVTISVHLYVRWMTSSQFGYFYMAKHND